MLSVKLTKTRDYFTILSFISLKMKNSLRETFDKFMNSCFRM